MLPILVYVAGIAPKPAVGMSMAIVGDTSLVGSFLHWQRRNVLPRTLLLFCVTGVPGAYIGSIATHKVPSAVLLGLFSSLMVVVALRMLAGTDSLGAVNATCSPYRCITAGLAVGLVTGFLGVGGGFLIVPALVWFAALDARKAIGTALGIIAVNSAAGLASQFHYAQWDWALTGKFLMCSLIGMGVGISVASRVPERSLRKAFAVLVLCVALAMGGQLLRSR